MSFLLPNPSTPTNGQAGDATPILQNELALAQAIAAFDGSQINAKSVTENALADSINPRLRASETMESFVYSGCTWSALSGANGTMTGGTIYVNGYRTIVTGVGSKTFPLSNDTYVDIDYLGNLTYNSVANGATAPSLTANAIRVAKVVTSGSAITTVTQTGSDGNGTIIYPIGAASADDLQNPVKFRVFRSAAYTTTGTNTLIRMPYDAKSFDTGTNVDIVTNPGRFTVTVPGFYQFNARWGTGSATSNINNIALFKNGAEASRGAYLQYTANPMGNTVSDFLQLAVTDYIEVFYSSNGAVVADVGSAYNYFSGFLVSAT